MHALSVKQPWCEQIAIGRKKDEYRTWAPRALIGRDLLIVASRTPGPGFDGEPLGVAICVVRVESMRETANGYAWRLANPRRVSPVPIKGCAALWHVDDSIITFPATEDPARKALRLASVGVPAMPRERKLSRQTSAPRAPYVLRCGRIVVGEMSDPIKARALSRQIAASRGAPVDVARDGFHIYRTEPT